MIEVEIDGKKVSVPPGSMLMQAAELAGATIPHFCYHRKLSIAANCRMCLVEIEKAVKPMPACATPVTQGMVVHTHSDKAVRAQQAVMEFLLINHPLDCPICDQGGECQLQDLAVGYGRGHSRYEEEKRVVRAKDVGPLISMEEMSRCIQCTRCVRFGQEVAGVMELGMSNRGEHSEIETFVGRSIDSELSGNMIDICPVGALTSKPFRYSARTWELSRRRSISPHDSAGANLVVQVKNDKVMRVLPFENEAVNECWIADRDRFSYQALNSPDRLTEPMLKQGGQWRTVGWDVALDYVAEGLRSIAHEHGKDSVGLLASPHCTVEELYLAARLMRGLGSDNIDTRLRHADFSGTAAHWLGMPIAALSKLQRIVVVGSNLRKDHPLFAARIRAAVHAGAQIWDINATAHDYAMPVAKRSTVAAQQWPQALQDLEVQAWLAAAGGQGAILLGNAAAHHSQAEALLALAQQVAGPSQAQVGVLTESANTVGAALVQAFPQRGGKNARSMLQGGLKAALLLNCEPAFDSAYGVAGLAQTDMVVGLSPFVANLDVADVLLPIAPFSETSGSFVNAEGRLQSFYAVVRPLAQTRPAWKVLRVLGTMFDIPGFGLNSSQEVLQAALGVQTTNTLLHERLSNASASSAGATVTFASGGQTPCTASIYQLDSLVRRAPALQATADAALANAGGLNAPRFEYAAACTRVAQLRQAMAGLAAEEVAA